jgi:hypothetical protein
LNPYAQPVANRNVLPIMVTAARAVWFEPVLTEGEQTGVRSANRLRSLLPRSARWSDGENLATGNHEVVRVARVPGLGKSCVERGLEHGSRVVGAQLKPGTEPGLLVIRCIVDEFDADALRRES